jgi:hypothetical protein
MPMSAETASARGKVAAFARCVKTGERQPDDPEYVAAQRDLKAATLEAHIRRTVTAAPPLTVAQLARLGALFDLPQPAKLTRRGQRVKRLTVTQRRDCGA